MDIASNELLSLSHVWMIEYAMFKLSLKIKQLSVESFIHSSSTVKLYVSD